MKFNTFHFTYVVAYASDQCAARLFSVIVHLSHINGSFLSRIIGFHIFRPVGIRSSCFNSGKLLKAHAAAGQRLSLTKFRKL